MCDLQGLFFCVMDSEQITENFVQDILSLIEYEWGMDARHKSFGETVKQYKIFHFAEDFSMD
jgi:hypothetical protein